MPRLDRLRRSRPLRLLLAAFLVPVVLLANPTTATAAAGPWKNATVQALNPVTGYLDITCYLTLRQSGIAEIPGIEIGTNGYCVGGPDITPGAAQAGESGAAYVISVDGVTASGTACNGSRAGVLGAHGSNGTVRVAGSFSSSFINISQPCSIQRVGVRFDGTNGDQFTWSGVDLPATETPEEPETGACTAGTPHVKGEWVLWDDWGNNTGQWRYELTLSRNGGPPISTVGWGFAARWSNGEVTRGDWTNVSKHNIRATAQQGNPNYHPVGTQVYAVYPDGINNAVPDTYAENIWQSRPTAINQPYHGWTQPSFCRWYFGTPVVSDSTTDEDTPFGTGQDAYVPPPPPVDDPEPVPEQPEPIVEPPVDLGWLAMIWGLLRSILGVISGLVSGIVSGIKDGLRALFVPPPGEGFKSRVQAWDDPFSGRFPFNFGEVVEDFGGGGGISAREGTGGVSGSGCPDWTVKVGTFSASAVCDSPFTAAIRGARPFILAGMLGVAFMPLLRGIFYASVPLIKPSPTSEGGK